MGDTSHYLTADPRRSQVCAVLHPARGAQLLEHRQLQRCHGDRRWVEVCKVYITSNIFIAKHSLLKYHRIFNLIKIPSVGLLSDQNKTFVFYMMNIRYKATKSKETSIRVSNNIF